MMCPPEGKLFLSTLSLRRATPATTGNNKNNIFLSTLSLRRATNINSSVNTADKISIHALLAESDVTSVARVATTVISIHALLAESDHCDTLSALAPKEFLSTLSLRRATRPTFCGTEQRTYFYPRSPCGERRYLVNTYHRIFGISIHALLAESDSTA